MWGVVELGWRIIARLIENGAIWADDWGFHNGRERRKGQIRFLRLPRQDLLGQLLWRRDRYFLVAHIRQLAQAVEVSGMGEHLFDLGDPHLSEQGPQQFIASDPHQ